MSIGKNLAQQKIVTLVRIIKAFWQFISSRYNNVIVA